MTMTRAKKRYLYEVENGVTDLIYADWLRGYQCKITPIQQAVLDELKARGPFEIPNWPARNWAYRNGEMVLFPGAMNPGLATYRAMKNAGLIVLDRSNAKTVEGAIVKLGAFVRRGRCVFCNGTGETCQVCGEAEAACKCRGGFAGYECGDCGGMGK